MHPKVKNEYISAGTIEVQDAHSFWNWIYFVMLIVIGSFFMINLCLVVIATQFRCFVNDTNLIDLTIIVMQADLGSVRIYKDQNVKSSFSVRQSVERQQR